MMIVDEVVRQIIKNAKDKTSWRNRLEAIKKMENNDFPQKKDLIMQMAIHDKVFKVKEEAFRLAQKLGYRKGGKPVYLGKKDIGYKHSDFVKIFKRIRREVKVEIFDVEEIKRKLELFAPEMYDVMNYEKKEKFDKWIEKMFLSLPKK